MKKIVSYQRVSSQHQDSTHQMESIKIYAKNNNLTIERSFKDEGFSAYSQEYTSRPSFMELLELVQSGQVSDILVFESSRISRQRLEFEYLMDLFTKHGVRVHSTSENVILNQHELDALLLSIKAFFNEQSSKETSRRIKSSKELLKKEGKFIGGRCAWGFYNKDGYEVPIENMIPIVQSFFNDYITHGRKYVADKYGIKNRKTIINRISNPKYITIVGNGVFNRANELRANRSCTLDKPTRGLNRSDILLESLMHHECGCKLTIHRDRNGHKHYWRCSRCKGNPNITIKKSFGRSLDANVEADIIKILDELNQEKLLCKYTSSFDRVNAVLNVQKDLIDKSIIEKEKTLRLANKKLEGYILEDDDILIRSISNLINTTTHELQELKDKKEGLDQELKELIKKQSYQHEFISNVLNAKSIYQDANIQDKKAILQLLIKKIVVRDTSDYDIYLSI